MSEVQDLYRIGTVAKLTGISVERLRAWERRYGLMPAERAGKTRMYSADQVERLTRIRQLIDQGHPISTLIQLSNEQLSDRLTPAHSQASGPRPVSSRTLNRVGLIGTQLLMLEQANANKTPPIAGIDVAARWVTLEAFRADLAKANLSITTPTTKPPATAPTPRSPTRGAGNAPLEHPEELDLLVVLIPSLSPDSLQELAEIPQKKLVIYHFATPQALALATSGELRIARWPISWPELCQAIGRLAGAPLRADYRYPRRFADAQLLDMASIGTALGCDCPMELIDLISRLNAFSEHSSVCREPSDSHTGAHHELQMHTSAARAALETALGDWVDAQQASEPYRN